MLLFGNPPGGSPPWLLLLMIPLWSYFFVGANGVYARHLRRNIQKFLSLEGAERLDYIKRRGGTSLTAPVILYALVLLLLLAPVLLLLFPGVQPGI